LNKYTTTFLKIAIDFVAAPLSDSACILLERSIVSFPWERGRPARIL